MRYKKAVVERARCQASAACEGISHIELGRRNEGRQVERKKEGERRRSELDPQPTIYRVTYQVEPNLPLT